VDGKSEKWIGRKPASAGLALGFSQIGAGG
jgi:hypothetical protein